jgi:hypothetical protein
MQLIAFLLARAKEPSSYAGLAMILTAAGIHYSTAQLDAVVNLAIAMAGAIAVLLPEGKPRTGGSLHTMAPIFLLGALGALVSACSATSVASNAGAATTAINTTVTNANADLAALQPLFQTLCAGGAWADAQFQAVSSVTNLGSAVISDEAKAAAALTTLCNSAPSNVTTALTTATALYKQITTATPVVTSVSVAAAPAAPATTP